MREKDGKTVTALFGGSGLLAFKEDSTYRINDSTTGAYQTIDWNTGCVGPLAVCGSDEGIFVWGLTASTGAAASARSSSSATSCGPASSPRTSTRRRSR
jgi:hypothetical protein